MRKIKDEGVGVRWAATAFCYGSSGFGFNVEEQKAAKAGITEAARVSASECLSLGTLWCYCPCGFCSGIGA